MALDVNCKTIARSLLTILLSAAFLWAGDPWKEKPYTEWTERDIAKVNQDSPWAKRFTTYSGDCITQWASSLTMRQAMVREGQLQGTMTEEGMTQLLTTAPTQYVVAVRGQCVGNILAGFEKLTEEVVRESVYLNPKLRKQKFHPVGIQIFAAEEPPAGWFYFLREVNGKPVIGADEEKVEFHWGPIRTTFDLHKMVRDGKADL